MKLRITLFFLIVFSILFAKETNIFDVKTPFKEAAIYLKTTGNTSGNKIIYIKDWGKKSAIYTLTETKVLGITNKEKTLEIITPEWIYNFNMIDKTGYKSHNPQLYIKEEYEKLSNEDKKKFEENAKSMSVNMLTAFNGTVTENAEKIMGYNCDKIEVMGSEIYNIHNTDITLKTKTNFMGFNVEMVAVKIDKGKVPKEKFNLPNDIEVIYNAQADEMAKQTAINMVHSIVEGKNPSSETNQKQIDKKDNNKQEEENFKDAMKDLQNLFGN